MSHDPSPKAGLPRGLEIAFCLVALAMAAPVLVAVALAIAAIDGRPVLYGQTRVGLRGRPFRLHKLRTLDVRTPDDAVTPEGDARVTRLGRWLRGLRIDELPQLFDVLRGDMALVGPRPVREVDLGFVDPESRERFLSVKPGITGPVQLDFIAEDAVLRTCADPARVYREVLVPAKVAASLRALGARSVWSDLRCLGRTPWVMVSPGVRARSWTRVREAVGDGASRDRTDPGPT